MRPVSLGNTPTPIAPPSNPRVDLSANSTRPATPSSTTTDDFHPGGLQPPTAPGRPATTGLLPPTHLGAGLKRTQGAGEAVTLDRPIHWLYEMPVDVRPNSHFNPHRVSPVDGKVRPHRGIDLPAPEGTPIQAPMSGEIIAVTPNNGGAGNTIKLRDDYGRIHKFFHLSEFDTALGDRVDQGDVIGKVGTTGRSTGPHLHWEVWEDGSAVNPWTEIRGIGIQSREEMLKAIEKAGNTGTKKEGALPFNVE